MAWLVVAGVLIVSFLVAVCLSLILPGYVIGILSIVGIIDVLTLTGVREVRGWRAKEASRMIGLVGTALTWIRPEGRAEVCGRRFHVETEGDSIERGQRVRIVSVQGNRVVVVLDREA